MSFRSFTFARFLALLKFLLLKYSTKVFFKGLVFIGPRVEIKCKGQGIITLLKKVYLKKDIELYSEGELKIKENVFMNNSSCIVCLDKIIIEKNVIIGERVSIRDHDHIYADVKTAIYKQGYVSSPVLIKKNSWIGCNSVVLKGVEIGCHCVIAANTVVNKNVPDYTVVAGIPAKIIKKWDFDLNKWVSYKEELK